MYRALILCSCLLVWTSVQADMRIYKWIDTQGNTHFSHVAPHNKSISLEILMIKTDGREGLSLKALIDSAEQIAKSNAERKASNDKIRQEVEKQRLVQEQCETRKKNLAELDYGSNRLYKNSEGDYSRLSAEDKRQEREKLSAFINENCH